MSEPTVNYNVFANLELNAKKALSGIETVQGKVEKFKNAIDGLKRPWDSMFGSAIALGGAYVGFQAITGAVKSIAVGAIEANSQMESLTASIATIYANVEKVSFTKASEDAKVLYGRMQQIALVSTATTQQLGDIFAGIYGPLRNTGLSIRTILDTTNNASIAASALGVDFAQATRDINAMARGTAGLDVKTFSLLQSMGLIKETTEQWNKMDATKRAKTLVDVMSKFGGQAAEAYGKTWKGLTSTAEDIFAALKRSLGAPIFERMKSQLDKLNTYLLNNREHLAEMLSNIGEKVAVVFDAVVDRSRRAFQWLITNFTMLREQFNGVMNRLDAYKPFIIQGLKFAGELKLASLALGALMPVLSVLSTLLSGLISVAGSIGAAGGIGAAVAGAGTAITGFLAAVAAAAGPILLIAAAVAAVALAIYHYKDQLVAALMPLWTSIKGIASQLWAVAKELWDAFAPILTVIGGGILFGLIAQLRIFAGILDKVVMPIVRVFAAVLSWVAETILQPIFEALSVVIQAAMASLKVFGEALSWLADHITGFFGGIFDWVSDKLTNGESDGRYEKNADSVIYKKIMGEVYGTQAIAGAQREANLKARAEAEAAKKRKQEEDEKRILDATRPAAIVDMKGSTINIKQEFREADPDNVWVQFREGLENEITARTHSAFADPLAR